MGVIANTYRENGYVIIRNAFDNNFLSMLEGALFKPFVILAKSLFGETIGSCESMQERHNIMVRIKDANPSYYINAMKVSQNDPAILAAAGYPNLISNLKKLGLSHPVVSLKPYPIMVSSDLAIEDGYNLRPAHQEWPVMQGSHNGVVAWFPLHDILTGHSSLEVYPKSHLDGVLPYDISRCGSKVVTNELGEPEALNLKRGDLVLFSSFTVHKSGESANHLRASMSIRFNDLEEQSFISRGYADNTSLIIKREPMDKMHHEFSAKNE